MGVSNGERWLGNRRRFDRRVSLHKVLEIVWWSRLDRRRVVVVVVGGGGVVVGFASFIAWPQAETLHQVWDRRSERSHFDIFVSESGIGMSVASDMRGMTGAGGGAGVFNQ